MSKIDGRLLEILCCPITRRPLNVLDGDTLARVNAAIAAGKVRNHGGAVISAPLESALVTTEGDLIYPVRQGIPVLLEEECIHWAAFSD
ncbi:MAG: Trm112 family protein [Gammaproteobacteria bacterium]|jgi:uncharacterized protein YbaR (Trm112 family)